MHIMRQDSNPSDIHPQVYGAGFSTGQEAGDCVTPVSKDKNTEGCASKSFLVGTPLM